MSKLLEAIAEVARKGLDLELFLLLSHVYNEVRAQQHKIRELIALRMKAQGGQLVDQAPQAGPREEHRLLARLREVLQQLLNNRLVALVALQLPLLAPVAVELLERDAQLGDVARLHLREDRQLAHEGHVVEVGFREEVNVGGDDQEKEKCVLLDRLPERLHPLLVVHAQQLQLPGGQGREIILNASDLELHVVRVIVEGGHHLLEVRELQRVSLHERVVDGMVDSELLVKVDGVQLHDGPALVHYRMTNYR